jgi:hypothetical protein
MFVTVFALVLLGACWYMGEVSLLTRILFTLIYLASWGLLFLPEYAGAAFIVAQCVLIVVFGVATFGIGFLNRRM